MRTEPVLLKDNPSADCVASRLTVCDVLRVVMLKMATSAAPGFADGSGVVAPLTVDQGVRLFQLEPVPSQKRFAACAAKPIAKARNQAQIAISIFMLRGPRRKKI